MRSNKSRERESTNPNNTTCKRTCKCTHTMYFRNNNLQNRNDTPILVTVDVMC